jgi:hypothetical protein
MTDYQQRIAQLRARVTPGAKHYDLVKLHNHLLSIAPHIRIGSRWGDYTSYTVKLRDKDAVALTDGKIIIPPHGAGRYRIALGARLGTTHARFEYWEPEPLIQWDTWEGIEERVWEWLRQRQPAAEALLEIDLRLLAMQFFVEVQP